MPARSVQLAVSSTRRSPKIHSVSSTLLLFRSLWSVRLGWAFAIACIASCHGSVDSAGSEDGGGDHDYQNSVFPSISFDGATFSFEAHANDLVIDDTNEVTDVFVTWLP